MALEISRAFASHAPWRESSFLKIDVSKEDLLIDRVPEIISLDDIIPDTMSGEPIVPIPNNEEDSRPAEILADGLASLLNEKGVVQSISRFIDASAAHLEKRAGIIKTSMVVGVVFSAMVFLVIAALGWHKVISPEATTGLLGALIGYWFGQREGKPQ